MLADTTSGIFITHVVDLVPRAPPPWLVLMATLETHDHITGSTVIPLLPRWRKPIGPVVVKMEISHWSVLADYLITLFSFFFFPPLRFAARLQRLNVTFRDWQLAKRCGYWSPLPLCHERQREFADNLWAASARQLAADPSPSFSLSLSLSPPCRKWRTQAVSPRNTLV